MWPRGSSAPGFRWGLHLPLAQPVLVYAVEEVCAAGTEVQRARSQKPKGKEGLVVKRAALSVYMSFTTRC